MFDVSEIRKIISRSAGRIRLVAVISEECLERLQKQNLYDQWYADLTKMLIKADTPIELQKQIQDKIKKYANNITEKDFVILKATIELQKVENTD